MGLYAYFKTLDQKFSWSFLGFFLGIIGIGLAIYTYVHEKKPNLQFELINVSRVYDIREDIPKLDVIYEGENIRQKSLTLSIINFRVINNGNADILLPHYDSAAPLGFSVTDAHVVKPEKQSASNAYLQDAVHIKSGNGSNDFNFTPVILEAGQFFALKVIVLHPEKVIPKIVPHGKIASVNTIKIIQFAQSANEEPRLKKFLNGFRADWFFPVLIGIFAVLSKLLVDLGPEYSKRKRKKTAQAYRQKKGEKLTVFEEALLGIYLTRGEQPLLKAEAWAKNSDKEQGDLMMCSILAEESPLKPVFSKEYASGIREALELLCDHLVPGKMATDEIDAVGHF